MSPAVSTRFLQTQSDARLVTLAGRGHERAFEALVLRYRGQLFAYCRRLLLPTSRAEDAVQQGLLQAWLALQRGTEVRDAKSWLYRIVHNAAISALRSSGYDHGELSEALQGAGAPDADLDRRTAVREALAGLAALPAMQREALLRTAVDGISHDAVAVELGLSEDAVRGLVYRARTALRAAATALTPPPLVAWVAGAGRPAAPPLVQRLAELGAGGGTAGVAAVLVKGSAVAITAGAAIAGTAALQAGHGVAHATAGVPQATRAAVTGQPARGGHVSNGPTSSQAAIEPVARRRLAVDGSRVRARSGESESPLVSFGSSNSLDGGSSSGDVGQANAGGDGVSSAAPDSAPKSRSDGGGGSAPGEGGQPASNAPRGGDGETSSGPSPVDGTPGPVLGNSPSGGAAGPVRDHHVGHDGFTATDGPSSSSSDGSRSGAPDAGR